MWPKSRYWLHGPKVAKNGNSKYAKRDQAEILAYIAQNGPSSVFDVELCCMMNKTAVMKHLVALEGRHKIEKCEGKTWQVVA
jgi:predicted transcriptional regulator